MTKHAWAKLHPKTKPLLPCTPLVLYGSNCHLCSNPLFPMQEELFKVFVILYSPQSIFLRPLPSFSPNTQAKHFLFLYHCPFPLFDKMNVSLSNNTTQKMGILPLCTRRTAWFWSFRQKICCLCFIYSNWKEKLFHRHDAPMMDFIQEKCDHI